MNNCIFCKIITGEIPSYTLYEDEKIKVFLDINPVSKGHSLYIPKKHFTDLSEIPEEEIIFLQKLPSIASSIKEAVDAPAYNILQSNGKAAGQEIFHVHFHIIPRHPNDAILKFPPQGKLQNDDAQNILSNFNIKYNRKN